MPGSALQWIGVHGRAAAHDWLVGEPGDFVRSTAALRASVQSGTAMAVHSIVTRSTYRELPALVPHLLGARAWVIDFAAPPPAPHDAQPQQPRLALAVPHALAAATAARREGLPSFVRGVPACLLGPHADWRVDPDRTEAERGYRERCSVCAARAACAGADPRYLARYGGEELRPLDDAAPPSEAPAAIADVFGRGAR